MTSSAQSRRWRAARVLCWLLASACSLGVALGCHGQADRPAYASASAPPPPPLVVAAPHRVPPAVARVTPPAAPSWVPADELHGKPTSTEVGMASWYGTPYKGRKAANGEVYDENALTAAHRTLPMGTLARVTNLTTGESVVVKITDRGPFVIGRSLDLSPAAAKSISVYRMGLAKVRIEAYVSSAADPAGRWCVQIGAFIDPADAVQLKNDLIHRFGTAKVIEFPGATGHWVRINPSPADRTTATRIAESIHLPDAEPYLIRLN